MSTEETYESQQEGRSRGGQASGRKQAEELGSSLAGRIPHEKKVEGGMVSGQKQAEELGSSLADRIPMEKKIEGGKKGGAVQHERAMERRGESGE